MLLRGLRRAGAVALRAGCRRAALAWSLQPLPPGPWAELLRLKIRVVSPGAQGAPTP